MVDFICGRNKNRFTASAGQSGDHVSYRRVQKNRNS